MQEQNGQPQRPSVTVRQPHELANLAPPVEVPEAQSANVITSVKAGDELILTFVRPEPAVVFDGDIPMPVRTRVTGRVVLSQDAAVRLRDLLCRLYGIPTPEQVAKQAEHDAGRDNGG